MKFFTIITILSLIKLGLQETLDTQNSKRFILDEDLSKRHDWGYSGFVEGQSTSSEIAQIPPLEILFDTSSDNFIREKLLNRYYGQLGILYQLNSLNYSLLTSLFHKVSILQNDKSIWAPLVLVQLSLEYQIDVKSKTENPLHILHNFVEKSNSNWTFPINAGFYIIFRRENLWDIIEIYSIKKMIIVQKVDPDGQSGIHYYTLIQKDERRADFRKQVFVGISMDVHGYELATDFDDDNTTDQFVGGFEVKFYQYLKDALNFTEKAMRGSNYVREGPGGTLTGMAVPINNEQADISISSTEFLEYRTSGPDGFSYLLPTFKLGMQAYFKQPPASSIRDVFTSGFSFWLWISMFGLWVFICLSMHLAYRIYFKEERYKSQKSWNDALMSDEISIWAAAAMCQQSWYFTPCFTGTRIIFFFGWFTGFICYIAYSAQLVSILSVEVVPIQSFEDLLRENFFLYNDNHIPTTKYYVKGLQEREIIPTVPEDMRNVDIANTFHRMIKSTSAMISISDSFYPILQTMSLSEDFICKTVSNVGIGARSVIMSMFVKRASPTRSIFNTKILQMLERGVNNRILRGYFIATSVRCLTGRSGLNKPLGSQDIFTAYVILLSGFILSSAIVVVEQLFRRMWKNTEILDPDMTIRESSDAIMQFPHRNSNPSNIIDLYMNRIE